MASSHPRRRPQRAMSPISSLRKSETFSAATRLNTDLVDIDNARYMPRRSPTCIKTLEDYVSQTDIITSRQERIANYLAGVDDLVEGRTSDLSASNEQVVYAVPQLMISRQSFPEPMEIDQKKDEPNHHHYSDSGIGSSVDTPVADQGTINSLSSSVASLATAHSAITRSFSSESTVPRRSGPELSQSGFRQIQDRILKPILANPDLKAYHPLVKSIPSQVDAKYIANLRDLEKTFLYSAPVSFSTYLSACAVAYYHGRDVKKFSLSPDSFENFWNFSIRCLHATVEYLAERDQRKPADRPYTNNYFLDLVEQIRRYAEIMARTREKEENGEELDEMDFSPNERVVIEGGLSTNGRPAELIRKKDGKSIPLAPEIGDIDTMSTISAKRPYDDEDFSDDDDVLRSMARRRKSDKAGDVMHVCSSCSKEFKRPCDLTKHEKTHSRPFKCTEPSCRYHSLGWPTEKERDRHVNDKHSSQPMMYDCHFKPCTYSSKRESNCKQHMEKAHGWQYVRSKSNGRKKAGTSTAGSVTMQSPSTPFSAYAATPASSHVLGTPQSNFEPSPYMPMSNDFNTMQSPAQPLFELFPTRRDSVTTAATNFSYSSGFSPNQFNQSLDSISPIDNFDFNSPINATNSDFFSLAMQPPTASSHQMPDFTFNYPQQSMDTVMDNISPEAASLTLLSNENMFRDEGYVDDSMLHNDFTLFGGDSTTPNPISTNWLDASGMPGNSQLDFGFGADSIFPQ